MRISASVSSVETRYLSSAVTKLDESGVDFYHLDSIEDRRIFGFAETLRKLTKKPFDLHLITTDPVKYWDDIRASDISEVTIQLESLRVPLHVPADLRSRVGVALLSNRKADFFKLHVRTAPSLLLMTTTPGKSGGTFTRDQFGNIMRYRILYPQVPATVDGGVTGEVASVLGFMGVSRVVSGSYLIKAENMGKQLDSLRNELPVSVLLEEVILPEPEILVRFSVRLPEQVEFISAEGVIMTKDVKTGWLDAIGAKTVAGQAGPFSTIFASEKIQLEKLREIYREMKEKPQMVVAVNNNDEVSGVFCLSGFNYTE